MPGGISSGAGCVPSSAGRAGAALPAQLVTHASSDTSRAGTGLRGQCRACCAHAECQLQPCPPCRYNSSLPCSLQERGQEEQKPHLGAKHHHVFPAELGSAQQPSGKPFPGTLLAACHMWGEKLGGFSAQIWQSPSPQLSSRSGSWRGSSITAVAALAPLGHLHKVPVPSSCSSTWEPRAHFFNQFSFQGAFDTSKPQTQAPEDPQLEHLAVCYCLTPLEQRNTDINLSVRVFHWEAVIDLFMHCACTKWY